MLGVANFIQCNTQNAIIIIKSCAYYFLLFQSWQYFNFTCPPHFFLLIGILVLSAMVHTPTPTVIVVIHYQYHHRCHCIMLSLDVIKTSTNLQMQLVQQWYNKKSMNTHDQAVANLGIYDLMCQPISQLDDCVFLAITHK